jgi:Holliday junction resolvasome RuvABC endonuclease subunit
MIYIGIDPGLSGAVATITPEGGIGVYLYDTPTAETGKGTKRDYLIANMANILDHMVDPFCVIEAVHSMPKQGVASSFSFGRGLGIWEGILSAYKIPYAKVAPQTWKKAMLGDMPRDNKDSSRIAATRLFPQVSAQLSRKKDDGRAEALLMAEYGKRLKEGNVR